jgi:hypothetical protein
MHSVRKGSRRRGGISERMGLVLLVLDLWRRLPPKRRRQVLGLARKHGPRLARKVYAARRSSHRR